MSDFNADTPEDVEYVIRLEARDGSRACMWIRRDDIADHGLEKMASIKAGVMATLPGMAYTDDA